MTINESVRNKYLEALFEGIQFVDLENQASNRVAYAELSNYQLIILNDLTNISSGLAAAMGQYASQGGNLLIFPSRNANIQDYNNFLAQLNLNTLEAFEEVDKEVGTLNMEEFIFKDVFEKRTRNIKLPKVSGTFKLKKFQSRGEETIMIYRDGSSYIGKYRTDSGNIYLCSSPLSLDYNDLVQNAEIFVPMVFRMAISSANGEAISYTIGENRIVEIISEKNISDIVYKVTGTQEFIPSQLNAGGKILLNLGDNISEAGIYNVEINDNVVKKLAFNYNKLESQLDYLNTADLAEKFGDQVNIFSNQLEANFTQLIEEKDQGITYWKWCLILALLFLAIEQLLLRLWSA